MATRSAISKKTLINEYVAIYNHWDGYPEHTGRILKKFYPTEEEVDGLLKLGDITQLKFNYDEIEKCFENNPEARKFNNFIELLDWARNQGCEWVYVFDKKWRTIKI